MEKEMLDFTNWMEDEDGVFTYELSEHISFTLEPSYIELDTDDDILYNVFVVVNGFNKRGAFYKKELISEGHDIYESVHAAIDYVDLCII